jgi:iron-sulfur cluster repair protein YtfE (RIC family)
MKLAAYLEQDHERCDRLFDQARGQAEVGGWGDAAASLAAFRRALERHFAMEEAVLFAAIESARGGSIGPTQQMRLEHLDMRDLAQQMAAAAARRDSQTFAGTGETLRIMLEQHNLKEERVLYPMAEQILGADAARVLADMQRVEAPEDLRL